LVSNAPWILLWKIMSDVSTLDFSFDLLCDWNECSTSSGNDWLYDNCCYSVFED